MLSCPRTYCNAKEFGAFAGLCQKVRRRDSFIHVSELDSVVDSSRPLCEIKQPPITEMHRAIARHVSALIDDGAVLQTGIGGIPDAVLPFLTDRKDLAVHSEMLLANPGEVFFPARLHQQSVIMTGEDAEMKAQILPFHCAKPGSQVRAS